MFLPYLLPLKAVQDLFMIPLLALPQLAEAFKESDHMIVTHAGLYCVVVLLLILGSILFARSLINAAVVNTGESDLFSLSVVAYALTFATVAEELELSIEAGAIFAGLVLIKSPHVLKVVGSISSLSRVFGGTYGSHNVISSESMLYHNIPFSLHNALFIVGMYLTSLGMIISPTFVSENLMSIVGLVCFIGLFKLTVVSFVLRKFFEQGSMRSLSAGMSMAHISEGSLIVLAKAQRLGVISRQTYLTL